jgi:hypothetical protein
MKIKQLSTSGCISVKNYAIIFAIILSPSAFSSEWAIGPIALGDKLSKIERITSVTSEYAGGCGVISLNVSENPKLFYAAPYEEVELWFQSTNRNARLGSMVLSFSADKYHLIFETLRVLTGKAGDREGQSYIFDNGMTNFLINQDNNFLEIRFKSFSCKETSRNS